MQSRPPRRRPARPVADAPIDALLIHLEDLTKGWLLALLEEAPLEDAPAILGADLTRDGPRVCDAVVRALADDRDLSRIEPGGALEPLVAATGAIAGAAGAADSSRAVELLQAVVWTALRAELEVDDAELVAQLAERLALVCELVRTAVLRRLEQPEVVVAPAADAENRSRLLSLADRQDRQRVEQAEGESEPASGETLWVGALEEEISRARRTNAPLSLLLVELEEADRIAAVEEDGMASAMLGRFAQAVRSVMRRQDILACETDTRAWIVASDTSRTGAQAVGERVADAVREAGLWRGAPLRVSVGVAVFGEDGRESGALIEAAEEAMFAAAASGVDLLDGREH